MPREQMTVMHCTSRRCVRLAAWGVLFGSTLLNCSGDTTDPVSAPATQAFWAVQFDWPAVNLALTAPPGVPVPDTIHLHATALTLAGTTLPGAVVQYHSIDSSVTVDTTGLVTARYLTSATGTAVVASLTAHGVTLTDTAHIQVTQTPLSSPVATFSIQPRPDGLDSAKYAVDGVIYYNDPVLTAYVTTQDQTQVCGVSQGCPLLVAYSSSDTTIASVYNSPRGHEVGYIKTFLPGHVTLYASTMAYGIGKRDSLPFVVGYPVTTNDAVINVQNATPLGKTTPILSFEPASITIGVGGLVAFNTSLLTPIDVIFDSDTFHVNTFGGAARNHSLDVYPLVNDTTNSGLTQSAFIAEFLIAGTYTYHSSLFGTRGTITVSSGP